ncbi:cupin domain-containing protein [Methylovirgula sp. 4M-Z18]|uniref:cupin domain-containing protein n=1 Tax=Methylovirgula sp. 4M-Z18 TaxID=2293567 RepID=UPI000E2F7308|nr:cupin domain-containing protein [Methylovirgula sp. 4M-Z18]RFB80789.1 cupin domain-containing protein [Methylovirgula sp. 4M-Z18]
MSETEKPIVNLANVPLHALSHGEKFAVQLGRIGPLIGAKKLGCSLHIVPPGKIAFPFHAHHVNEEMFLVLQGNGTYRCGTETFAICEGDVIAAPPGDGSCAHQIINSGSENMRYLAFSTRLDPEVVEYPDSNKFAVSSMVPENEGPWAARVRHIGRPGTSLDYWDGE